MAFQPTDRAAEPKSPPGTTYGVPVEMNSLGYRNAELEIPKREGLRRIVVLGDSFTWGVGLPLDRTIPKLIEHEIAVTEVLLPE